MKILIIGCGYVGLALLQFFETLPYEVSVTTRKPSRIEEFGERTSSVHVIKSSADIPGLVPEYDVVIFLVGADSKDHYREAYLLNAKAIVSGLQKSDKQQQVIYTSTTSVYGDHHGDWVDETTVLKPMTPQAEILVETEKVLLNASAPAKNICVFRLGGITGPGRSIEERIVRNAGGTFPGDGMSYTNLSPLNMILGGIGYAIDHHLAGVYNLCSDDHTIRKDFYDKICREHNLPLIRWDPEKINFHAGNKRVSSKKYQSLYTELKF